MKRREFLKKTAKATVLAAACGGTGYLLHNRETDIYKPVLIKNISFEVPVDNNIPKVVFAKDENIINALHKSLDSIGGIKRFVKSGERVTIKPNVGWDRTPEQAANTNPILVGEMVRQCYDAGASDVIVSDVTCNDPRRCFLRSGIREEAEKAGARVILEKEEDYVDVNLNGEMLTVWPVLKYFIETDRFINMPITKHHSLTRCTLGMKNLYGIIGGSRNRLHQKIDQSIVDLAEFARPTLTVIDCSRVLLRSGPQGGSLDDVSIKNSVICTTDQVAGDSRAVEFLGTTGDQIGHITLAEKSGLGLVDYNKAGYKEII